MTQVREQHIVSAAVDAKTRAELERRAAEADRTLSGEIRRALREWLARADTEEEEART
jgi:hypothetical protein